MKRIFEFVCEDGHVSEALVDSETRSISCKECGKEATRIISMPQVKLDGCSGHFPSAYDAWSKKRSEKLAQERKKNSL